MQLIHETLCKILFHGEATFAYFFYTRFMRSVCRKSGSDFTPCISTSLIRLVTNRLDIVPVQINNECAVVIWVVMLA